MTKLIPNEPLIYERADGVVYARYSQRPEIPRWIIGGDPGSVYAVQNDMLNYIEWQRLCELAQENASLKKQLDNLIQTYYIIKDGK